VRKGGFHDENVSLPGALQSFALGIEIIRSTRCEPVVSVFLKNWKIEMERIALYLERIALYLKKRKSEKAESGKLVSEVSSCTRRHCASA
jgi:hypothetical protein